MIADFPYQFLVPFSLVDLILKGFALWMAAHKEQKGWFIAILFINTLGILPLIYLFLNRRDIKISASLK